MSIVDSKRLISCYESGKTDWTADEKELLVFALYCVYRNRAKDSVTLSFELEEAQRRIAELERHNEQMIKALENDIGEKSRLNRRIAKLERERDELEFKADLSADRQWISGAGFGWNCGQQDMGETYRKTVGLRHKQIQEALTEKPQKGAEQ